MTIYGHSFRMYTRRGVRKKPTMKQLRRTAVLCLFALLTICIAHSALAADAGGINARARLEREQERNAAILDGSQDTWIEPFDVDRYLQFKENLKEATGFEYLSYYTLMNHYGTEGGSDAQNLNGQVHTINAWTPNHGCPDAGTAIFYYMHTSQYTQTTAAQLSNNLGLTSGINDTDGTIDLFRFAAWYQPLHDGDIELYFGQFLLRDIYDFGSYATDDTRNFVSQIMSANAPATLPAPGLAMAATVRVTDDWYVGGGFSDANARPRDLWNFDTFSQGDYASMGYVSYRPYICGLGQGNYQFNIYSVDATSNAAYSRGLSLILEQDIGERHAAFLKYNRADKRQGDIQQSMAAGLLLKGLHIWEDDLVGIGAGWGDPTNPARRDEYVLEAFWRMQITPGVQITPDVQIWLDPSQTPTDDVQAVFSLRALVEI